MPDFTYRALLVDAAGTLLIPSEPAAEVVPVPMLILAACVCCPFGFLISWLQVYLRYGEKYGVTLSPHEVLLRFRQ